MKEKLKARKPSFLKISVPLWLVFAIIILSISLISILSNENSKLEKALANPFVITATPTYYGSSDSQVTFIEALGSPTPDVESTAEVEVSTRTIMCHEIERSDNGQFVFRMFLQSGMELFRIDEDGTNFCRLTNNTGNDDYPVWSPDGTKIAYISTEGVYGLYQMETEERLQMQQLFLLHTKLLQQRVALS